MAYLGLNEYPYHPMGFAQHGYTKEMIDKPSYSHLGKKIKWNDLNDDCKKAVNETYQFVWDITEENKKENLFINWNIVNRIHVYHIYIYISTTKMKRKFTREEVKDMLVSVLFFSASNQKGLQKIRGNTFAEQANTVIQITENSPLSINLNFK